MAKRKPMPSAAARGPKNRPKKPRPGKQGAEPREENPQLSEHDDEIVDTESGAAETVQRDKKANWGFQGIAQSDEDDIQDEYDAPSGDVPGDTINNGNDCFDAETSCSFHRHVSNIITNEQVKVLMKKNYKFKWEMPAVDIPRSKWVGTGEKLQEACDDHLRDVKGKLRDHWQRMLSDHLNSRMSFFSLCNSYRDIMHCNKKPFYLKSNGPDSSTMDAYLMHALNHVHRTRDVVIRNDAKLRNDSDRDISDDKTYLDQGFTRPKVLFLLPLKSFARRIVKRLIQLSPLPQKDSAMGQFKKEFGESDDEGIPEHSTKPADFDLLFAGDIDDHFIFGIKLTKKSIKLYSNFYSSDIIVASPLALKRKIDGGEHGKEKDFDFLSSIEIVVVDHADVISMQNWEHLEAVFEQLNQLPTKEHGTNVMRIRPWYLDQHAQYYRQTILLSSYLTPEINALFNGLCLNYEGKIKMVTGYAGVLPKIQLQVRQICVNKVLMPWIQNPPVYERFDASSISEADDARFDYFCNKVYPKIQDLDEGGLLLFVSSYFEYIRISNFLKSKEASFCRIGEATSQQDISRSRLWFFEGKKKILLYSERSHFYHRYKIRGTKHLLIYSLPGRKEFYPELVNMLGESEIRKCNVLFSRLDLLKLERIVGTSSARRLISSDKGMFVFC